jgi:PAS domain S-box-containing protein
MSKRLRVLLVVGSSDDARVTLAELRRGDFDPFVRWVATAEAMADALDHDPWDAVIVHDQAVAYEGEPAFDAAVALRLLHASGRHLPVLVVSAREEVERAVEVMREGAKDVILTSNPARLGSALRRELAIAADERARRGAEETQRKLAAKIDDGVRRLAAQIQGLPLAYVVVDDEMRVLEWNPTAEKMFGYPRDEIVGRDALELIFPLPINERVLDVLRRLRQGDQDAQGVHANVTKEGRRITCKWSSTRLLDAAGRFVGAVSLVQDVTEKEALEEQVRQSHKLETIGQLAAGIAHDFSGFATTINICTHLLGELLGPDTQVRQLFDEIRKAAERSTALTRQLLAFSVQQTLAPRVVSVNKVVRDAEDMLRRVLPENIRLSIKLDSDAHTVTADPAQLERILFNLVVNARDAMPAGGTISLETSSLIGNDQGQTGMPPGRYTAMAVSDSGVGMPEEVRLRIFEPFFTTKEPGGAGGMGLTVVHGIVKQSGGFISVDSRPGHGTCFKIYFPCAIADPPASSRE